MAEKIEFPHGDYRRYRRRKCRCPECRAANTAYHKRVREERIAKVALAGLPAGVEHGRLSTYKNYGCRCDDCTEAVRNKHLINVIMNEERRLGRA